MIKTYKSKNTIEAIKISEELFEEYGKMAEAQELNLKEIPIYVHENLANCSINAIAKTLNYQGIILQLGDYLVKSGNSFEPCPKDKFEDEFEECVLSPLLIEEIEEKVEELFNNDPESGKFVDKVNNVIASFFGNTNPDEDKQEEEISEETESEEKDEEKN